MDQNSQWECTHCHHVFTAQAIKEIEEQRDFSRLSDTHHLVVRQSYETIKGQTDVSDPDTLHETVSTCELLLPIFEKLGDPFAKSILLRALSRAKLKMLSADLKNGTMDKPKYLKAVKPYLALQMHANSLTNKFGS